MGNKVALVIGVGRYGDASGLQPLTCPANGVQAMAEVLGDRNIGQFDQVIPLIDPDVGTLRSRLAEVFTQLNKADLGLLYFTGHGLKDMTGDFYLTTADSCLFADGRINPGTAVEGEFVKRILGNSPAQRKVLILDCCFAGAIADSFLTYDDGTVDVAADLGGKGWCIMTAATGRKYALEQVGESLSVYSRYLVDGLKTGGAAPEGQTQISVRHWHDYVYRAVKAAAPAMEPAIFNGEQGDTILVAQAAINPEHRYRQEVQAVQRNGKIFGAARLNLKLQQTRLGLSAEQAAAIEQSVLQPYEEKQRHLADYETALREEIEASYPLDAEAIRILQRLQTTLGLRDVDIQPLLDRIEVEQSVVLDPVLTTTTVPSPAPVTLSAEPPPQPTPLIAQFEVVTVDRQGQISQRQPGQARYVVENLGQGVTLELVAIPAGAFDMGSPKDEVGRYDREGPQHRVKVSAFWLGKVPVTQAQYQAVMGKNPSHFTENGANRPVEQVSWRDAVAFCEQLSQQTGKVYRLPSEAEWEYACRAGTMTPFYFGTTLTAELANYDASKTYAQEASGTYRQQTTPVGQFPPNAFGLYDLHGNVWEWCLDHWHENYQGAPTNSDAWLSSDEGARRVLRGGSWYGNPRNCRSANRIGDGPDLQYFLIGFRVACSLPGL